MTENEKIEMMTISFDLPPRMQFRMTEAFLNASNAAKGDGRLDHAEIFAEFARLILETKTLPFLPERPTTLRPAMYLVDAFKENSK